MSYEELKESYEIVKQALKYACKDDAIRIRRALEIGAELNQKNKELSDGKDKF